MVSGECRGSLLRRLALFLVLSTNAASSQQAFAPSALETPLHPASFPFGSRAEVSALLRSRGKFPAFSHLLRVAVVALSAGKCQATQELDSTPGRGGQRLGPGVTCISFLACLRVLPSSPSPIPHYAPIPIRHNPPGIFKPHSQHGGFSEEKHTLLPSGSRQSREGVLRTGQSSLRICTIWTSSLRVYVYMFVVFFIYHHGLDGALVENA